MRYPPVKNRMVIRVSHSHLRQGVISCRVVISWLRAASQVASGSMREKTLSLRKNGFHSVNLLWTLWNSCVFWHGNEQLNLKRVLRYLLEIAEFKAQGIKVFIFLAIWNLTKLLMILDFCQQFCSGLSGLCHTHRLNFSIDKIRTRNLLRFRSFFCPQTYYIYVHIPLELRN